MLKLACPTCGANLELPEQLDIAHCMYCGSKIILRSENILNEMVSLKRFSELANIAMQAKNYEDATKYSNRILEIDTQNIESWLTKAEAVFWLSTPRDDKFSAAMQYIETASSIAPEDARVTETRNKLAINYSLWLNGRGVDALKHAQDIHNIWASGYASGIVDMMANTVRAKAESGKEYAQAMELFLNASKYDVHNITALQNIRVCALEAPWFPWSPFVLEKIKLLSSLEAKEIAKKNIAGIEKTLAQMKSKLNSLQGKNGFWDKLTRSDLQDEVIALEKQLRQNQVVASYEIPHNNV